MSPVCRSGGISGGATASFVSGAVGNRSSSGRRPGTDTSGGNGARTARRCAVARRAGQWRRGQRECEAAVEEVGTAERAAVAAGAPRSPETACLDPPARRRARKGSRENSRRPQGDEDAGRLRPRAPSHGLKWNTLCQSNAQHVQLLANQHDLLHFIIRNDVAIVVYTNIVVIQRPKAYLANPWLCGYLSQNVEFGSNLARQNALNRQRVALSHVSGVMAATHG